MRLQIFSDLHVDVRTPRPITMAPDIDAVVVAGDTCEGAEAGFAWLRGIVPMQLPIIAVLGNHEFYRRVLSAELAQARSATRVVCNAHGYGSENAAFDPALVVEIG